MTPTSLLSARLSSTRRLVSGLIATVPLPECLYLAPLDRYAWTVHDLLSDILCAY